MSRSSFCGALFKAGAAAIILTWQCPAIAAEAPAVIARGHVDCPGGVVQIAATRDGIIVQVPVREGAEVRKGDPLAVQDDTFDRLNLDLAMSELSSARQGLRASDLKKAAADRENARLKGLVHEQLANSQELDLSSDNLELLHAENAQAHSLVETAETKGRIAQYLVDTRTIRAPLDGQIVKVLVRPGEGTSSQYVTTLFWLAPAGRVVHAELEEAAVRAVKVGQSAEVVTEGSPGTVVHAKVERIAQIYGSRPTLTENSTDRQDVRVVDCILTLEPTSPALLIGQRVLVRFLPFGGEQ